MAKKRTSLLEFFNEVKREVTKVTWPTKKEVIITSCMVFVMVMVFATFFIIVDKFLSMGVRFILGVDA